MSEYYNPYDEPDKTDEPVKTDIKPKKTEPKPKKKAEPKANRGRGRWSMFWGGLLLLISCFMFVAMVSALIHADADQTRAAYQSVSEMAHSGEPVKNSGGPLGAWIGFQLLSGSFGVGSFVLLFWVGAMALRLLGFYKPKFWSFTFKTLVLAIALSVVVGLVTFSMPSVVSWGGYHGYYVNRWLIDYTSVFGAICVSIALTMAVIIIYLTEITMMIKASRAKVAALREKQEAARHESEHRRKAASAGLTPEPQAEPEETEEPKPADPVDVSDSTDTYDDEEGDEGFVVTVNEIEEADHIDTSTFDPTAELSHFHFPPIDLLEDRQDSTVTIDAEQQEANKNKLLAALAQFNIQIKSIKATVGPTITLYEVVPEEGQRIATIKRVEEDLALALKATSIRIIAPMPGKGTVGIEVPNSDPQVVSMRSIIASKKFQECKYELPMALGATISNDVFVADLTKMPHLLVAGATGQGKSVGLNAIITSLLYKKHPAELKFVLVDPKMVEFSLYRRLEQHYLAKLPDAEEAVITDMNAVVATLNSLCVEMDRRYELMSKVGMRAVKEYNQRFIAKQLNPEHGHRFLPYIVLVVDEFADLIMTAGKEVETPICRLAQKARAVGIHVIIATQRPSTNVITGLIKANFPGRIAFRVAQMVDSKTILDRSGAHQLVGRGDMFFSTNGNLERVQCAFVDTPEVEAIVDCISDQPGFMTPYILPEPQNDLPMEGGAAYGGQGGNSYDRDPLFEEAAEFIVTSGQASTSSLQRRYAIGYNRAGKLMDQLEVAGIVGPASGSKPRTVLVDPMTLQSILQ